MFYGWRIVGVTFLTHFISVGFLFYSYGAFFKALAGEFGGSRLGVASGMAIVNVVTAAFAPFLGRWLDHGSIRNIMCLGALLMASGFLLVSRIAALWQFYLVLGTLIGLGSSMLGGLAGSTLVSNWFVSRRGTALGIATMGISLSGMVMAPLATWLISEFGWRSTFVVYAGVAVVVILPTAWWLIVNRPEDLGLLPDGQPPPAEPGPPPAPTVLPLAPGDQLTDHPARIEWSARHSLRNPNFWAITLAVSFSFCASSAVLTHIIPHATDIGLDPLAASTVLSVMAGIGMIGKVMFGWLTDRVSHRGALWVAIGLQAIGMGLFLRATEYGSLLAAGAVFGVGMGGLMPLWGAAIGAAFGRVAFGRVMGLMSPFMIPIQTIGIPFAGWMFDRTGSYELAFTSLLGVYALAFVSVTFLRIPDVEPGSEPLVSPV